MAYGWSAPVMVRLLSNDSDIHMTADEGSWVIATVEIGNMFTPIPGGFLSDIFGRKPVILSITPMYLIAWGLLIATRSYKILILVRLILGMAMGIVGTICPLYLAEVSEPNIRGKITSFCIVMWFFGILLAYCIGPYVSYDTFSYICVSLPAISGIGLCFIPESPYNLLMRGRYEQAKKELKKVRNGNDTNIINEIKLLENAMHENAAEKKTCSALVSDPVLKMSVFIFLVITVTGLFGGLTVMYAYATEIFSTVESNSFDADQCTIVLGFIYLLLSVFATVVVDNFGRKPLLLVSAGGSGISHLVAGIYFFLQKESSLNISSYSWILLLAMGGYCVFASIGIAPVTPVYQSEIFPNAIKSIASGVFTVAMCLFSVIALKMFQVINSNFGMYYSFWFFAFINISGCFLMHKYLVETKGKSLVVIQKELQILSKSTKSNTDVNETVPFKTGA